MTMTHNWLWLDLETTGLDEHAGQVLEVGAAVVDDGVDGSFDIVDAVDTVVLPTPGFEVLMDDYVKAMHTRNGLLSRIAEGEGMLIADADDMLASFVDQYLPAGLRVVLAGNSVHFDLRWVKRHMPKLAAKLSHQVFDVTTLKAAARVWGPGIDEVKADEHRALADVRASIACAKRYHALVTGPA